mmetsp:Transcript_1496/g.2690  ORF Transcript_1496/g.2690 Transcript_1496/m.2690 type:complete len:233 (+) Transcript_1496:1534-2232(+)
MVVQVVLVVLQFSVRGRGLETKWVSTNGVVEFLASHQYRQLIQSQVNTVLTFHQLAHPAEFSPANVDLTNRGTSNIVSDTGGERRGLGVATLKLGAQVLALFVLFGDGGNSTHGEIVVLKRDLCLLRLDQLGKDGDFLVEVVLFGGNAREEHLCQSDLLLPDDSLHLLLTELVVTECDSLICVAHFICSFLFKFDVLFESFCLLLFDLLTGHVCEFGIHESIPRGTEGHHSE